MRLSWLPFAALLLSLPAAWAAPSSYAFMSLPSRFETTQLTAGSRALGETCLSRDSMPDGSVCNPAMLGSVSESSLLGRVYFGNGFAAATSVNQLLFQPLTENFMRELFSKQNVTSLEVNAGLAFTTRYISAAFSPYRIQYLSEVHNPNFPVVAVHAARERSLEFATGTGLGVLSDSLSEFSAGLGLRLLERDYVHTHFTLFEVLAAKNPRSLVPLKSQRAYYFNPSLAWEHQKKADLFRGWKLRASAAATNLGSSSPADPLYPDSPDGEVGLGIEPKLPLGTLKLGLDLVDLVHGKDLSSRLRFGTSYRLGIMEAMGGLTSNTVTSGLQFGVQLFQVSIVYEFKRADLAVGGGSAPENKIATEASIRL